MTGNRKMKLKISTGLSYNDNFRISVASQKSFLYLSDKNKRSSASSPYTAHRQVRAKPIPSAGNTLNCSCSRRGIIAVSLRLPSPTRLPKR
jgi:hypothetical protein